MPSRPQPAPLDPAILKVQSDNSAIASTASLGSRAHPAPLVLVRKRTISGASTSSPVSTVSFASNNTHGTGFFSPTSIVCNSPTLAGYAYPPGIGWTPVAASGQLPTMPTFFPNSGGSAPSTPNSRAYPPGMGFTPHASTPGSRTVLLRKVSFGLEGYAVSSPVASLSISPTSGAGTKSRTSQILRTNSTSLGTICEASERVISRELLLCYRGNPTSLATANREEAAETAGFIYPKPGFLFVQEHQVAKVEQAAPKVAQKQFRTEAQPVKPYDVTKAQGQPPTAVWACILVCNSKQMAIPALPGAGSQLARCIAGPL